MTIEELTVYGAIGAPGTERTLAWELQIGRAHV